MSYLKFDIDACKDCYSCLRNCPVKSIKFVDNKAIIVEDMCILCGHCVNVCPQNAKKVISNIEQVEKLIKENPNKVALSVAPSFISNFDVENFEEFKNACMKLGFSIVEETAIGAKLVTKEYSKLMASKKYKALISSSCPAAVNFIQKNYPDCLKYVASTVSPMVAHARLLRHLHGEDLKIVFVGPCIAKKKEAFENKELVCALTFEEILSMFKKNNIEFEPVEVKEHFQNNARYYPINRGIIKSFDANENNDFDSISVDGVDEIKDILENIEELDNIFIEMNMCKGGCINGPAKISTRPRMKDNSLIRNYVKLGEGKQIDLSNIDIDLNTTYRPLKVNLKTPTEEETQKILNHIFKFKKEDEINCGACGYNTCRDKALAVFNGLSEPEFCMPYLKNKAESISNEIIQHTPNGIITVNSSGILIDANERAQLYLGISKTDLGKFYQEIIVLPELMEAIENEKNVDSIIVFVPETNAYYDVSITVVKEHGVAFAIYKDVTQETLNDEKMKALRNEMIEVTDKVINKQMAAVQEIASLLGESTAEAKIALVNFKNSLKDQE